MPARRAFTAIEVALLVFILVVGGLLALPTVKHGHGYNHRTKCASNLRQLGLAAIQYADDKRFFPHHNGILELDGDVASNHGTKINRALLWYGYHDNPEGWICSSSYDAYVPINDPDVRENMRLWFWGGDHAQARKDQTPWVDPAPDPALLETTELSYGWTRRGLNGSAFSTTILAADRARRVEPEETSGWRRPRPEPSLPGHAGNHTDGWNILRADGLVEFITPDHQDPSGQVGLAWLRSTQKRGGYLAIADVGGGR